MSEFIQFQEQLQPVRFGDTYHANTVEGRTNWSNNQPWIRQCLQFLESDSAGSTSIAKAAHDCDVPTLLQRTLERFFGLHPHAVLLEHDGQVAFDMANSRYSISSEYRRCVLQIWAEGQQNIVRTVMELWPAETAIKIKVRRFGRSTLESLMLIGDRETLLLRRKTVARAAYCRLLDSGSLHFWPGWKATVFRSNRRYAFGVGVAYALGSLTQGQRTQAVIAVNAKESKEQINGCLTAGLLWHHHCNTQSRNSRVVEGLSVIVPQGASDLIAARMTYLNHTIAKWCLFEHDLGENRLVEIELSTKAFQGSRRVRAVNNTLCGSRFEEAISVIRGLLPRENQSELKVASRRADLITLSIRGLTFVQIQLVPEPLNFNRTFVTTFGLGNQVTELNDQTSPLLEEIIARLIAERVPSGTKRNTMFRLQTDNWLASRVQEALPEIEPTLHPNHKYSLVMGPDRRLNDGASIHINSSGRVVVLQVRGEDDLHLPMRAIDAWGQTEQLCQSDPSTDAAPIKSLGYFTGLDLSPENPLLYLIVPGLQLNARTTIILSYFSKKVEWRIIGINQDWRTSCKVVFRKTAGGTESSAGNIIKRPERILPSRCMFNFGRHEFSHERAEA